MAARLLYRDGLMLVIDKPPGMAVHRGSPNSKDRNRESLEDHFDTLRFGLPRPPALAHRLDRDTSGCLVLGRHRKALAQLGRLFRDGAVGKTYWAVVEGAPPADEGEIDMPLGRLDDKIGWWMKPDPAGQPAVTRWRVMGTANANPPPWEDESGPGAERSNKATDVSHRLTNPFRAFIPNKGEGKLSWLALEPMTGRTHQLRVHCAAMGWPILGDSIYGHAPREGGPILHLHAHAIAVPLYKNRPPIQVTAPVPAHMKEHLARCGWLPEALAAE